MLDKAIKHGKERRQPYRRSRVFDRTCRNHGSCGYCEGNRTFDLKRERERTADALREARRAGLI